MLQVAIIFFGLGLIAVMMGVYGLTGLSTEVGNVFSVILLMFILISTYGAYTYIKTKRG